jgi:redox-sensitive bicupin YhaK (pirin superfamily)
MPSDRRIFATTVGRLAISLPAQNADERSAFPAGVFDRHSHRGMETLTYVIEGELEHYDNHDHKGTSPSSRASRRFSSDAT